MPVSTSKESAVERVRRVWREISDKLLADMLDMATTQSYGRTALEIPFEAGVPQCYQLSNTLRNKIEAL